jgi:hypothetical protein
VVQRIGYTYLQHQEHLQHNIMASTINASTTSTSGLVQTADASGVLQLQSNGVTGLTLSGNTATVNNLAVTGSTNLTECAQLASTVTYNIPDASAAIVPFNTVLISENLTINPTASTVNGIEAYHWKHSTTGIYRIRYDVRTTSDTWNMIAVCKNNNAALPVGNGYRTGTPSGIDGLTLECLYRVTDVSDRFSLFHWCAEASTGAQLTHASGNPPASFFVTPQVGTAPTTGYYSSIIITKL